MRLAAVAAVAAVAVVPAEAGPGEDEVVQRLVVDSKLETSGIKVCCAKRVGAMTKQSNIMKAKKKPLALYPSCLHIPSFANVKHPFPEARVPACGHLEMARLPVCGDEPTCVAVPQF